MPRYLTLAVHAVLLELASIQYTRALIKFSFLFGLFYSKKYLPLESFLSQRLINGLSTLFA